MRLLIRRLLSSDADSSTYCICDDLDWRGTTANNALVHRFNGRQRLERLDENRLLSLPDGGSEVEA